ncbi:uncharacterized protein LOC124596239 [Schistocerca americana]|uniref:uncharacterized protein LOC124596239 n=1 Tax=Schistocerca americana TaxID=7009 RepID=UPI001F4FD159|nr:uncharacterized protein LOC124596239 [Schistocerca americana]
MTIVNDSCDTEVTRVTEEAIVNEGYSEDDNSNYSQDIFTVEWAVRSTPVSTPLISPQSPLSEHYASARKRCRRDNEDELATSALSVLRDIQVSIIGGSEDKFWQ